MSRWAGCLVVLRFDIPLLQREQVVEHAVKCGLQQEESDYQQGDKEGPSGHPFRHLYS